LKSLLNANGDVKIFVHGGRDKNGEMSVIDEFAGSIRSLCYLHTLYNRMTKWVGI